jgi:hypothetical protein
VREALEKLETILPDLVNLNKMRASDWVRGRRTPWLPAPASAAAAAGSARRAK